MITRENVSKSLRIVSRHSALTTTHHTYVEKLCSLPPLVPSGLLSRHARVWAQFHRLVFRNSGLTSSVLLIPMWRRGRRLHLPFVCLAGISLAETEQTKGTQERIVSNNRRRSVVSFRNIEFGGGGGESDWQSYCITIFPDVFFSLANCLPPAYSCRAMAFDQIGGTWNYFNY